MKFILIFVFYVSSLFAWSQDNGAVPPTPQTTTAELPEVKGSIAEPTPEQKKHVKDAAKKAKQKKKKNKKDKSKKKQNKKKSKED